MKKLFLFCCLLLTAITTYAQQPDFPKLVGPYLGQKQPGTTPEIFAPGIVSTDAHEFSCCFSPDGNEFYFARTIPELGFAVLMYSKLADGVWTKPEIAPFVEKEYSFEPFVTPDNKRLYFNSGKQAPGQQGPGMNILYVEREGNGWSKPKNPGAPFNPFQAMHVTMANNGDIYTTDISGGMGTEGLGIIKNENGEYKKIEKLGSPLNKENLSMHPWISPDGNLMLFNVLRPGQKMDGVLCCSFKLKNGEWSDPKEIPLNINAGIPFVTTDGQYLFFHSGPRRGGDIYWVSAKIIEELRAKE